MSVPIRRVCAKRGLLRRALTMVREVTPQAPVIRKVF
jgi:hypothetical protein